MFKISLRILTKMDKCEILYALFLTVDFGTTTVRQNYEIKMHQLKMHAWMDRINMKWDEQIFVLEYNDIFNIH